MNFRSLVMVIAASVTLAVWLIQSYSGGVSLFTVGVAFLIVSVGCSALAFVKPSAPEAEPDVSMTAGSEQ